MKNNLLMLLTIAGIMLLSVKSFAQAPALGTAADFVLFTAVGAVGNTGLSHVTDNVGTNSGAITGFGYVNGVMHTSNGATAQSAADLLIAYNHLNSAIPNYFPAPLLGNGQILGEGVYAIAGPAALNNELKLDAQNDPDAVFIFQINGAFTTAALSTVTLINGAQACNVFWKIEGLVDMAAGTTMRGTVIANNGAIDINADGVLEGRALSTSGAVNVTGALLYTPIGCGSPVSGEPINLIAYNGVGKAVEATYDMSLSEFDGNYTLLGLSKITSHKESSTAGVEGTADAAKLITVFPNPASKLVTISSDVNIRQISLINLTGQMILDYPVSGNDVQVDISGFIPSLYFIKIETIDNYIVTKRLSIK